MSLKLIIEQRTRYCSLYRYNMHTRMVRDDHSNEKRSDKNVATRRANGFAQRQRLISESAIVTVVAGTMN